ncbi:MAG: hypothetical protein WC893_00760 [Candidatus Paceibacterota bacterium]|jgi:hypothetical protein
MKFKKAKNFLFIISVLLIFGFVNQVFALIIDEGLWNDPTSVIFDDSRTSPTGSLDLEYFLNNDLNSLGNIGGNPGTAQNAITQLSQSNIQTAQQEAQRLLQLQQADFEACQAQVGGFGGISNLGSGLTPPSGSSPVGSSGTLGDNEQATRETLASQGINVNKEPCNGRDYRTVPGGCTDVAGLPQLSIDRLGEMNQEMGGGGILLTGGTETGHRTHGPGQNVVDISPTTQSRQYVNNHMVDSYTSNLGTYYVLDTGDIFLDEGNHWHIQFKEKKSSVSGGNVALSTNQDNQNSLQLVKNKVQSFFSWLGKKIKKISLINIVNADSSVNLGGNLIDPSNISTENLQEIISSMSATQINQDFSQMNTSALSDLLEQMSFNSLNTVFDNLSSSNINNIVPRLDNNTLNNIADLLVEPSINNIFSNMSVTGFDSFLGNLEDETVNTLIGQLDQAGIDNLLRRGNDSILEQVFNNLGSGSVNNIIASGSGDLIQGVMNSLGKDSLENIFESVGISTAGKLIESLGPNFLNDVIPSMSGLGLDSVFGNLGAGNFENILSSISNENWGIVFSELGGAAAGDLINSLGTNMMDNILPILGDGAINNIFGNIGGDALSNLVNGISTGNLNNIFEGLGSNAINHTLSTLGDGFGGILPNLTDNALGNFLLGGDNSILQAALSGAPGDIVSAALDKIPGGILDQVSNIPIVGQFLGGGGGILGSVTGLVGGGLYVPVVEQQGQLMTATQNTDKQTASIDKTTQEIRDLSIQICTHLRAIRRIQTSIESMKIADEANANRTRLEALAKYANDIAGKDNPDSLIKTGYTKIVDGQYVNTQAFPKNLGEHLNEIDEEAKQVVLADINNSKNLYKEGLAELINDESLSQIDSTISKEDIKKFKEAGNKNAIQTAYSPSFSKRLLAYLPNFISKPLSRLAFWKTASAENQSVNTDSSSATDFWNMWFKITDPENNPYGSSMLAIEAKNRAQNIAEANARDEYLAGQGILPSGRKCVDEIKDQDGNLVACRKWETVAGEGAPGIIVKDTLSSALLAKYNTYLVPGGPESQPTDSAPDAHESATGNYETPTIAAAGSGQNTKPGPGADGQKIPVIDPSKTQQTVQQTQQNNTGTLSTGGFGETGTGGTTGTGENSLNWSNLLSQLSSLWNNSESDENNSELMLNILNILLTQAQNSFQGQPPLVQTKALSPSIAEISSGQKPNQIKLVWFTPNSTCEVDNNWLGRGKNGEIIIAMKKMEYLGKLGEKIISLPIPMKGSVTINEGDGEPKEITPTTTITTDYLTEKLTFDFSNISVTGQIKINIDGNVINFSATSLDDIVIKLNNELTERGITWLDVSLNESNSTLTIRRSELIYKVLCFNDNSEVIKIIDIER